jgi:hypothetical protein
VTHAGRGGLGNTRSPSTNGRAEIVQEEQLAAKLAAERRERELAADVPMSTGRGGAGEHGCIADRFDTDELLVGNIGGNRSRSRQRPVAQEPNGYYKDVDVSRTTTRTTAVGQPAYVVRDPIPRSTTHTDIFLQSGGRGGFGNIIPESELSPEERARVGWFGIRGETPLIPIFYPLARSRS